MNDQQKAKLEDLVVKVLNSSSENEENFTARLAAELDRNSDDFPSLSLSEAHVIEAVGQNPETTAAAIAAKLDITRGGISKIVARLQKKGYLEATTKEDNRKERRLTLTSKGELAFQAHEKLHQRRFEQMFQVLDNYSDDELDILVRIFADLAAIY